jgi:prevent-host-death family protein
MAEVTVRELRNHGGRVLERVARGEALVVTLDGRPVAELRPLAGRPLDAHSLLRRWRALPRIDREKLRADIDRYLDSAV